MSQQSSQIQNAQQYHCCLSNNCVSTQISRPTSLMSPKIQNKTVHNLYNLNQHVMPECQSLQVPHHSPIDHPQVHWKVFELDSLHFLKCQVFQIGEEE